MEIRLSKYNLPFCEYSGPNVHYISLDDQHDMRAGLFQAHVFEFLSSQKTGVIEFFDHISGVNHTVDLSGSSYFPPFVPVVAPPLTEEETQVLEELFSSGVKAAGRRLFNCSCGNANRPWRCTCNQ